MGLFSGWKPKTIVGKILKGVVSVGLPVAAAVTGVGAVAGAISGTGVIAGAVSAASKVSGVVKGGVTATGRVIDKVSTAAGNLVTGVTKEQREMIKEQKAETAADLQKIKTVEKLINAGATVEEAASKAGVALSSLAGLFGLPSETDIQTTQYAEEKQTIAGIGGDKNKMILYAAAAVIGIFLYQNF